MPTNPGDVNSAFAALQIAQSWLLAGAVLLARPMGLLVINPVFTRAEFSGFMRGVVTAGLVLPILPSFAASFHPDQITVVNGLLLVLKEGAIGVLLGLPVSLSFWTLITAGEIVDLQRGETQGRLPEPGGGEDVSITGTLFLFSGITVFVLSGGLEALVDVLYRSWSIWRPLEMLPLPDQRTPRLVLGLLDTVLRHGLELALPIVIAMLLAEAAMLIVIRMAPQVHLDDVATAARNLVFFIFLPLYIGYLMFYVRQDQAALYHVLDFIRPALDLTLIAPGPAPAR